MRTCTRCFGTFTGPPFGPIGAEWCIHCWFEAEVVTREVSPPVRSLAEVELEAELQALEADLEDAREDVGEAEQDLKDAEAKVDDLLRQLRDAESRLEGMQQRAGRKELATA